MLAVLHASASSARASALPDVGQEAPELLWSIERTKHLTRASDYQDDLRFPRSVADEPRHGILDGLARIVAREGVGSAAQQYSSHQSKDPKAKELKQKFALLLGLCTRCGIGIATSTPDTQISVNSVTGSCT